MVDVSSPHYCSQRSRKIISSEDKVSDLLGSRASATHGKSNISSVQSFNIRDGSSSGCDLSDTVKAFSSSLKSFNYLLSMSWGSLGKYSKVTEDVPYFCLVFTISSGCIEGLCIHDNILCRPDLASLTWASVTSPTCKATDLAVAKVSPVSILTVIRGSSAGPIAWRRALAAFGRILSSNPRAPTILIPRPAFGTKRPDKTSFKVFYGLI